MARIAGYRGDATFQLMSDYTEAATAGATGGPTSENPIEAKFGEHGIAAVTWGRGGPNKIGLGEPTVGVPE